MTREEKIAKLKILKNDFFQYAKLNLKIKTKEGKILPLEFNDPQIYIHEQIEKQLTETGKIRALILKGRQQGASTYTEGRFYWRTSLSFGKQAYILTHEQAATDNLFNMAKRYHDNTHPGLRPSTGASNAKEMLFDKLDSGYKVGTAGSKAVGRSGTIQFFHGSEIAFWPNAHEHFAGVVQCVPDGDDALGTEIILESTANGVGGKFHELWMQAINGESEYIAIFVPWFWTKGYRKDATNFKPTPEELRQQKLYGVDNEQLAWRRAKIEEMGKALCDQEYPYCWQDAFLASGRTVFDKEETASALKECFSPKKRMILENKRFIERKDGELRVWEEPKHGVRYCAGADVAEGLEFGDYSVCDILEIPSGKQVAQWHGHIAPDMFGEVLYHLGKWYNNMHVACENNNHGLTVNIKLRDMQYANIYVQTSLDDRGSSEKETRKLGFTTNRKSKPYIIDNLSALFREKDTGICCKETIVECQTYVVLPDGSYGGQVGTHDDRVMSIAIANYLLTQSPAYKK
jgi:hypothetical protein